MLTIVRRATRSGLGIMCDSVWCSLVLALLLYGCVSEPSSEKLGPFDDSIFDEAADVNVVGCTGPIQIALHNAPGWAFVLFGGDDGEIFGYGSWADEELLIDVFTDLPPDFYIQFFIPETGPIQFEFKGETVQFLHAFITAESIYVNGLWGYDNLIDTCSDIDIRDLLNTQDLFIHYYNE